MLTNHKVCSGRLIEHVHSLSQILYMYKKKICTAMPAKSDSDIILRLQLLSKTLACKLHFS